jgi:hypothetical protein
MSRLLMLLCVLALGACATLTPYQPLEGRYGYSEQKLDSDRYRIVFAGSSATPRQTVENYLLYRAAEMTVFNGGDHFIVSNASTQAEGDNSPSIGIGLGGFRFGGSGGLGIGVNTSTGGDRVAWRAQTDILVRKGAKPVAAADAYDAREVMSNLGPLVQRRTAE